VEVRPLARPNAEVPLAGAGRAGERRQTLAEGLSVLARDEADERLPHQEALADVEHLGRGAVGLVDRSVRVGDQVAVRRELEQLQVPLALALECRAGRCQLVVLLPQLLLGDAQLLDGGEQLGGLPLGAVVADDRYGDRALVQVGDAASHVVHPTAERVELGAERGVAPRGEAHRLGDRRHTPRASSDDLVTGR
jgi:hypothetical protein